MKIVVINLIQLFSIMGWAEDLAIKKIIYQNPKLQTTLYDVVNASELKNFSFEEVEALKLQIISEPMGDGEEKIIPRADYMEYVRSSILNNKKGYVWPDQIFIRNFSQSLNVESLKEKITSQIKEGCSTCQVEILDLLGYDKIPEHYQDWSVERIDYNNAGSQILIDLQIDQKKYPLQVILSVRDRVPVAKYNLKIGQEVNDKSYDYQFRDVSEIKFAYPKTDAELKNVVAKKSIIKNDVIYSGDVIKINIVKAGQNLKALVGEQDLNIAMEAIAHTAGNVGDLIPVKIKKTNKVIDAKIISANSVEVSL